MKKVDFSHKYTQNYISKAQSVTAKNLDHGIDS